jgi:cytochrome c biogenesis protein CcdA
MLVYLGIRTLREARKGSAPVTPPPSTLLARGRRPFAIGVMHGLAGSGALAALIALSTPTVSTGMACLALYAFGTVIGMVALAALAGPILVRAGKLPKVAGVLVQVAGVASILVGIAWVARTLAGV